MNENILIIRGEEHLNLDNQLLINHVIIASCALFTLSVWEKGRDDTCVWWWWFSHSVVPNSCDPMDYSPPGSSVHGILQARMLE